MKNVLREKIRKEGKERWRGGGREEERDRKEGLRAAAGEFHLRAH